MAFFAPGNDARIWLGGWYPETLAMQRAALAAVEPGSYADGGVAPLLEVFGSHDPFKPAGSRHALREKLGSRVSTAVVGDASHALFPEQPRAVADAIIPWAAHHQRT